MRIYQLFEIDSSGTRVLYNGLEMENAKKLAEAFAYTNIQKDKIYGFEPMQQMDKNDVDFSNEIINDLLREKIKVEHFLAEFLDRKEQIKEALSRMTSEALINGTKYKNLDELFNDDEYK